ncbi:MAG: lipopolysaccharide biosynthesis protein [Aquincola sp.]|nr:lipopolysaccharide biosynthesis protein [Aquincola sp.]
MDARNRNADPADDEGDAVSLLEIARLLAHRWQLLVVGSLGAGLVALGVTFLLPKVYTSRTLFVPPQQQQSAAASVIAQLGALSGLAGAATGIKSPADQYVSLLRSTTIADRLIDDFDLVRVYDVDFRIEARKELASNVRIELGKKDGLIAVEVDDEDPERAAKIANRHVDELRRLTSGLALTEAQQRRAFFETQLAQTRDRLTQAQAALQESGFSSAALRTDARAAAEGYARLRAEVTAAEVRLQTLRRNLSDTAAEVQLAMSTLSALRGQLSKLETATEAVGGPDYVGKFREFKYQETLFELFARQFELAKLDESREGVLTQVIDFATPPEKHSRPRRALVAVMTSLATLLLLSVAVIARQGRRGEGRRRRQRGRRRA